NHGPMHWRGDRTGANAAPSGQPDSGAFDERAAFKAFQVAFNGLLGRDGPIPDYDMESFTDFALAVTYPPIPICILDNSRTPHLPAPRPAAGSPVNLLRQPSIGQAGLPLLLIALSQRPPGRVPPRVPRHRLALVHRLRPAGGEGAPLPQRLPEGGDVRPGAPPL